MKKTLILTLASLALPMMAQAATITVTPATVTVAPGQKVTLTVSVNPTGKTISAVKAYISYPTNILTADSFAFASTWVPVTQTGFDQLGNGTILKTAGYPGGLTSAAAFGTITFRAKTAGIATVAVDSASSIAYDANTVNMLSGTQGSATIKVAQGTARTTGTQSTANSSNGSSGTVSNTATTTSDVTAGPEASTSSATASSSAAQAAAAGAAGAGSSWWKRLLVVIGIIIVVSAGWNILHRRK